MSKTVLAPSDTEAEPVLSIGLVTSGRPDGVFVDFFGVVFTGRFTGLAAGVVTGVAIGVTTGDGAAAGASATPAAATVFDAMDASPAPTALTGVTRKRYARPATRFDTCTVVAVLTPSETVCQVFPASAESSMM